MPSLVPLSLSHRSKVVKNGRLASRIDPLTRVFTTFVRCEEQEEAAGGGGRKGPVQLGFRRLLRHC